MHDEVDGHVVCQDNAKTLTSRRGTASLSLANHDACFCVKSTVHVTSCGRVKPQYAIRRLRNISL